MRETNTSSGADATTAGPPTGTQLEAFPLGAGTETSPLNINGDPADWETLPGQWTEFNTITFNQSCATRYPNSNLPTDLAGRVRFAYDNTFLYVAFQVDDDGYVGYSGEDQTYFLGDSPQLSLDMDFLGDYGDASRNSDDWQVDFLPTPDAPQIILWQLGSLSARPFAEAQVAVTPTASGYFLEAALPWSAFNLSPKAGDRLGLAANINDNDSPNTNSQECIISTAPDRQWDVPSTWGTLLLSPPQ